MNQRVSDVPRAAIKFVEACGIKGERAVYFAGLIHSEICEALEESKSPAQLRERLSKLSDVIRSAA